MKALSIRQPWAWAIVRPDLSKKERFEAARKNLIKDVENRDWKYPPSYRGQLLIHASKTFDREDLFWITDHFPELGTSIPEKFRIGGFVGLCRLNDVVTEDDSLWFFGPLGFKLRMPQPIKFIPFKGQLGLFDVPDEIVKRVEVIK